jgi:hypothetical protein
MDFSDRNVLLRALDNQDLSTVLKCIKAGQDLHPKDGGLLDSILFESLWMKGYEHRFWICMAFRKHINLNSRMGNTTVLTMALTVASSQLKIREAHYLIQHGADVDFVITYALKHNCV